MLLFCKAFCRSRYLTIHLAGADALRFSLVNYTTGGKETIAIVRGIAKTY